MDVDEPIEKEDGWALIVEEEYNLESVRVYLKNSCLAEKCSFLNDITEVSDEKVEELCTSLLKLLDDQTTLDELTVLFVVACMMYTMEGASVESLEIRTNFLHAVFFHSDTLAPQHIHVAVERIWDGLKIPDNNSYVLNVLSLCREIAIVNATGKAIAICLAWTILCEITETEVDMHRFREFSEINVMLKEVDEEMLKMEESTQIIYILIQVVGFLINSIVFGSKTEFISCGYRQYFKYKRQDLEQLKEWAEQLSGFFNVSVSNCVTNYWDLRMSMAEYIKMNIVSLLDDKIRDMQ